MPAGIEFLRDRSIALSITSALRDLKYPFVGARVITDKFGNLPDGKYGCKVNGEDLGLRDSVEMRSGLRAKIDS